MCPHARFRNVLTHVRAVRPDIEDPMTAIQEARLLVGGIIVTNPAAQVPCDSAVKLRQAKPLRGEAKLQHAIRSFHISVADLVCLDLGASAGGFTKVLLHEGARLVYALDVGVTQLRSEIRRDPRVVDLEKTNLAQASMVLPSEPLLDLITADLSYISLSDAIPQLAGAPVRAGAILVALVKPQFELGLQRPPEGDEDLGRSLLKARKGVEAAGWQTIGAIPSPVTGSRGSKEFLLHARWQGA